MLRTGAAVQSETAFSFAKCSTLWGAQPRPAGWIQIHLLGSPIERVDFENHWTPSRIRTHRELIEVVAALELEHQAFANRRPAWGSEVSARSPIGHDGIPDRPAGRGQGDFSLAGPFSAPASC
jgi:hypothetical protein